jgi:hypothetical protein
VTGLKSFSVLLLRSGSHFFAVVAAAGSVISAIDDEDDEEEMSITSAIGEEHFLSRNPSRCDSGTIRSSSESSKADMVSNGQS